MNSIKTYQVLSLTMTAQIGKILLKAILITAGIYFLLTLIPRYDIDENMDDIMVSNTKLPDFYFSILPSWYNESLCLETESPVKKSKIYWLSRGMNMHTWQKWQQLIQTTANEPGLERAHQLLYVTSQVEIADIINSLPNNHEGANQLNEFNQHNLIKANRSVLLNGIKLYWWGTKNTFHQSLFFDGNATVQWFQIKQAFKYTIYFSLWVFVIAGILGTLGGLTLMRSQGRRHSILQMMYNLLYVIPTICLATLAVQFFSSDYYSPWLNWIAALGTFATLTGGSFWTELKIFRLLCLPALMSAIPLAAGIALRWAASYADVQNRAFLNPLRSKGLSHKRIFNIHLLKACAQPIVLYLSMVFPALLGGAVIIENIFAIPGLGRLTLQVIQRQDTSTLLCVLFITTLVSLVCTQVGKMLSLRIDPRNQTGRITPIQS